MYMYIDREEDNAYSLHVYIGLHDHTLGYEPKPQGSWNLQFCRSFLNYIGHHYYRLSLSDVCLRVDKKRRNVAFSQYGHAPAQEPQLHPSTRTPAPRIMNCIILVDSSLVIITILSVCLIYAWMLKQEAHRPHHSPEKTVQINKHI